MASHRAESLMLLDSAQTQAEFEAAPASFKKFGWPFLPSGYSRGTDYVVNHPSADRGFSQQHPSYSQDRVDVDLVK